MRNQLTRAALSTLAILGVCSAASAQFTAVGPFTGNTQEGFETQDLSGGVFPVCIADRVFAGQADLCAENGSGSAHITGGWGFGCSIQEQEGTRLFGCTGGPALYTFDTGVTRFGGYFGTNNPSASNGTIDFLDASGGVLHSDVLTFVNDCTWNWHGWDTGGALVSAIRVTSNYSSGGYAMMDGMQADILGGSSGAEFCACDGTGTASPCGNNGSAGNGCANSVGGGAHLTGAGIASISLNSLSLTGSGLVPNQPGLYFQGNNATNGGLGSLFGDGLRCAGGSVVRLQIRTSDASGNSSTTIDIGATGGVSSGETKRYQLWYRNPGFSSCGSAFNLTNGIEVVWTP